MYLETAGNGTSGTHSDGVIRVMACINLWQHIDVVCSIEGAAQVTVTLLMNQINLEELGLSSTTTTNASFCLA